ncbi:MAG TPA: hypothetical protein VFA05_01170 [Gaiellaceae bacterium]|nr:hypothetical protein [Gaiellaceae bacterium]
MEVHDDDPNAERERLAREAMGRDPDGADDPPEGGPWAKTSSGDADSVTDDD